MMPDKRTITSVSIFIIWLFTISAISGVSIGQLEWFMSKTPLNLLLIITILILAYPVKELKVVLLFLFIAVSSIFAEWLGVNYGLIFGEYTYGKNFGPQIGGVPYLIGVNWAYLSLITAAMASHWFKNFWARVIAGAGLMVLLDFFLEFSAPRFDFWYWKDGVPPIQNYIGWFALSFIYQLIYQKLKIKGNALISYNIYASQLLFFAYFFFFFRS